MTRATCTKLLRDGYYPRNPELEMSKSDNDAVELKRGNAEKCKRRRRLRRM